MRELRRSLTIVGLLFVALLPAAAVVTPDAASSEVALAGGHLPLAIAQPVTTVNPAIARLPGLISPVHLDALLLGVVGAGLVLLGSVVRRVT